MCSSLKLPLFIYDPVDLWTDVSNLWCVFCPMTFGCVCRICLHDITILFVPPREISLLLFPSYFQEVFLDWRMRRASVSCYQHRAPVWVLRWRPRADSGPETAPFAARPPKVPIACQRPIPKFLFIICVWLRSINTVAPPAVWLLRKRSCSAAFTAFTPLRLSTLSFSRSQHRKFPNNRKLSFGVPARAEGGSGFFCLISRLTGCWPANNAPMACGRGGDGQRQGRGRCIHTRCSSGIERVSLKSTRH